MDERCNDDDEVVVVVLMVLMVLEEENYETMKMEDTCRVVEWQIVSRWMEEMS